MERRREKAKELHLQGVSRRKVTTVKRSPSSRHTKDYSDRGCSLISSCGSWFVENLDTAVAEGISTCCQLGLTPSQGYGA